MPEQLTFEIKELIAAAVFILSGGGIGTVLAKNKGWITFGKAIERRKCPSVRRACDEHTALIVDISNITSEVTELKKSQRKNNDLLRDIAGQVNRLVGFHQGKNGINLSE